MPANHILNQITHHYPLDQKSLPTKSDPTVGGVINSQNFFALGDWGAEPPDPPFVPTNPQMIFLKTPSYLQPQNNVENFVTFDNLQCQIIKASNIVRSLFRFFTGGSGGEAPEKKMGF